MVLALSSLALFFAHFAQVAHDDEFGSVNTNFSFFSRRSNSLNALSASKPHNKMCHMTPPEVRKSGKKSTGCGPVYTRIDSLEISKMAYRFDVDAHTMTLLPDAYVDARCTCNRTNGTKGSCMFEADRTLGVHRWPVVRLRGGSMTEVVLLSTRFFALTTHWSNATFPCCGDDCPCCELLPSRGLFYVAVHCASRISILELGSQSASHFEQHAKLLHGGMKPGLVFQLTRQGAKHPVRSEVVRTQEKCSEVSQLELATRVMCLYKYPCPNPGEDLAAYERRCRAVAKVRCTRTAETLVNKRDRQMSR